MNFDVSTISKAIAGGTVSALVALAARYGFQPHPETVTAVGAILTVLIGYIVGHVVVYLSPANKPK